MEQLQAHFGESSRISEKGASSDESAINSVPLETRGNNEQQDEDDHHGIKFKDWGFKLDRLFEVAYRFYKRNESKAFHPSFDVRNQMNALILQARYGNFDEGRAPDVGVLDLVGKNRRYQWSMLKAYAEAVKISSGLQQRTDGANGNNLESRGSLHCQAENDEQLKAIHTSLCRQTYEQFKNYAEKQHPGDVAMQRYLISSLQEQYYQQYISQLNPKVNNTPNGNSSCINSDTVSIQPTKSNETTTLPVNDNLLKSDISFNEVSGSVAFATLETHKTDEKIAAAKQNPTPDVIQDEQPKQTLNGTHETVKEAKESLKASSSTRASPFMQPTVYRNVGPESIGKFESYPEPKPLPSAPLRRSTSGSFAINIPPQSEDREQTSPEPKNTQTNVISKPVTIPVVQQTSMQNPAPPLVKTPTSYSTIAPERLSTPEYPEVTTSKQIDPVQSTTSSSTKEELVKQKDAVDSWSLNGRSSGTDSPLQQSITYDPLEPAEFWTRKGVQEFTESLMGDVNAGTYTVYPSTLLHIEVPTYPNGKYIYWEFATEDYDIGFGLDFVYDAHVAKPLSIKIYEQTDDEEEDEDDEERTNELVTAIDDVEMTQGSSNEIENGARSPSQTRRRLLELRRIMKNERLANTVSIIPTYRRDSHQEVFIGRHKYPGQGYYLLKFDNTYSLFYSKKIHYRICYFI